MSQVVLSGADSYQQIASVLAQLQSKKYLLVCDSSFSYLNIHNYFTELKTPCVIFDGFTSNPLYEDVCKGVDLFRTEKCDAIVAVGGGSTLDVAKCIKLFCKMDSGQNYLTQEYSDSGVPLIAIPTTAGTGSESTRYAVIYYEGKKQSVTYDSIIPNYAILEASVLKTLPLYQKKCTMLDALCQGIESWWSVNSTEESKNYSKTAVEMIIHNKDAYIRDNTDEAAGKIMIAANYAGRAINITQTTAAHAMSYKLTSMYQLPHGHAVAVCLPEVWAYMIGHPEKCIDGRGAEYLCGIFNDISEALECKTADESVCLFRCMLAELDMKYPVAVDREAELELLAQSVNLVRLKNNPVSLDNSTIHELYERIVK